MKIEMWLPVGASAKFEAEIDVDGKTAKEVFDEFMNNCSETGFLCRQCSESIISDFEIMDDVDDNDEFYIKEIEEDCLNK